MVTKNPHNYSGRINLCIMFTLFIYMRFVFQTSYCIQVQSFKSFEILLHISRKIEDVSLLFS